MRFIVQGYPAYAYTGGRPFDTRRPSVLLLHGAAVDHSVWQWQSRYLAHHGFNVLAVDLPGHGQSPGWLRGGIAELAAWVLALMDAAEIRTAALVGHSMGSLAALETALQARQRITRVALLGSAVPMAVGEPFLAAARADSADGVAMEAIWGHAPGQRLGASAVPGNVLVQGSFALIRRSEPQVQYTSLNACNTYAPDAARVATLACPALVLIGTRDQMTPPRAGRALAKLLPAARVVTVDAGHTMMSEAPRAVTQALDTFLREGGGV